MRSRPPVLDFSDVNRDSTGPQPPPYIVNSEGGATEPTQPPFELKSPPLPTPPLAKEKNEAKGTFELDIEKALGKVGKGETEAEKKQPLLELTLPVGLD
jgi:hypothetical protein